MTYVYTVTPKEGGVEVSVSRDGQVRARVWGINELVALVATAESYALASAPPAVDHASWESVVQLVLQVAQGGEGGVVVIGSESAN